MLTGKECSVILRPIDRNGSFRPLTTARVLYFFYYMAAGAYLPFIALYYQRIGLSGAQIGSLSAVYLAVASSASSLWGGIADRFRLHRQVLSLALCLNPVAIYLLSRTQQFGLLFPIIVLFAVAIAPISPLLDSLALEVAGMHRSTYGGLRVCGTVGWIVSAWLVGKLIEAWGLQWLFYSYFLY